MRALVLGASGLIGGEVARVLAGEGIALRLHHHRRLDRTRALAAELADAGGEVEVVGADLRAPEGAERAVEGLPRLDLLVNAIGAYARAPLADTDPALLQDMLARNVAAPLWAIRAAAPLLRAARGQVIQLLDIAAQQPWRDHVAYAASRAAMAHAVRCLALELAPEVRCNAIAPGLVAGAGAIDEEDFDALQGRIPAGRAATASEVAEVVRLLATSPSTVTGQVLAVDGGRSLGRRRP